MTKTIIPIKRMTIEGQKAKEKKLRKALETVIFDLIDPQNIFFLSDIATFRKLLPSSLLFSVFHDQFTQFCQF